MTFKKAERTQATLKIALTGPSGSGKTMSGLIIAAAIGKKIAVVDSENKSASLYADMAKGPLAGVAFDVLEIDPPYTIAKYIEAIEAAEKAGYDVLLVDSISHAWAGEGGLLDKKTALDARGGNSYTNWATITPEQERFKARILQANMHLICTMRSKQDYVLELNDKGKQVPKKVGLAPIQRDGMEYEFTTVFDVAMDHNAVASKDRTGLFDGQVFKISKETGVKIMEWLKAGKAAAASCPKGDAPKPSAPPAAGPTTGQLAKFATAKATLAELDINEETMWKGIHKFSQQSFKRQVTELSDFTETETDLVLGYLSRWETKLRAEDAARQGANV